ncbi:hypothetical protein [Pseudidiomarina mangrovi]|uniref:hypothetical protein n=1 Tax=Pseudidiomarina mangrovi TaxID=2487133 RepID=UPI000FCB8107|nr:hypothetical protein [Pseudidiomarina mangrovi]
MERQVSVSFHFLKIYMNASVSPPRCHPNELSDQAKFNQFIERYLAHGFGDAMHFPGRLKESTDVDTNDRQFVAKVQFARKHMLWHYHIGIPCYDSVSLGNRGDWLSAYVLNFQRFSDHKIKLVDLNSHPPFELPRDNHLEGEIAIPGGNTRHLKVVK